MKSLKNLILTCLLTVPCAGVMNAQWVDITAAYLQNTGFDGNSTEGWTWTSDANSQTCNYECMEFWNGTFDFWQTVENLPRGKYRFSVQAYYRTGDNSSAYQDYRNGTETLTARLYAGSQEQTLASVYSYEFPDYVSGCWTYSTGGRYGETHYFPDNMASASTAFANGAYQNSVEFETEGGNVQVGLRNDTWAYSNWCIFDNFKLEYQGTVVKVTSLTLSVDKTNLLVGEQIQCKTTVLPANALIKKLAWTSSNESVATVDANGLVKAVGVGSTTIKATTTDGSSLSKSVVIRVSESQITPSSLVVNEVMVSNVDEYVSPAYNFDGWVEFFNTTNSNLSLAGYYVSDDAANLKKWRIPSSLGLVPARGYRVLWFNSNDIASQNAPFKLDVDGGTLYVSNSKGEQLLSFTYPEGKERVSYARTTDGGDTWGFTEHPTPGATNVGSNFAASQLAAPLIDQPSKLFESAFTATVTIPAGTTLRYTLDGSLPTMTNGFTSTNGIFQISGTTNLRLRLFADGMLASRVTTRSYIYKNKDYYLPVVSVVGDDRFFYDDSLGVLVKGVNGRPGNGQSSPCNWNMNWERPVNFSYLTSEGEMALNQDVELEMCGGWSRAWSPHSFKLKGSKEMGGVKDLLYPFFEQKPYIRNRTLQIRNGGNETDTRLKDAALQYIVQTSGIDVDCQSYQPVHEFINGEYIGVLNVREPNNKHYVYANYGWDDDEIDLFEMGPDSGYVQKCGTADSFEELLALSANASNSATYAEICKMLDIDEYVNYMAAEFYLGSTDWPQNNIKAFYHQGDGKYRVVLFDIDFAFNTSDPFNVFLGKEYHLFSELYPAGQERIYAQIKFVTLFKNLVKNSTFRRRFIDAFCLMGGSVFEASRAAAIIDRLAERVNPAMQLENRSVISSANSIKNNLNGRLATATNYLKNYSDLSLSSKTAQSVTLSSNVAGAQLLINGQQVPTGYFKGNLFSPVKLKAVAPAGYAFQGWVKDNGSSAKALFDMGTSWKYYDQGSLDGKNWTSPTYNESGWKQGNAPLGYSNKVTMSTQLDYGTDSNNKRPTYYFRKTITLDEAPAPNDVFNLEYYIDDGLVVYVNGSEAGRFNMPSGTISYNTLSSTYGDQFPTGTISLPASLFHKGSNVIAVEVHNNNYDSTDIIFDAALTAYLSNSNPVEYYSTQQELSLPAGTVNLTAYYTALSQQQLTAQGITPVRINEVSGSNSIFVNEYGKKNDWVELYNTTDEEIDVEGMFLTDNVEKPTKYMITKGSTRANTKIPAHGYLLVWCDKLETTSQGLHASFKVSGEGGYLILTAADRSWSDKITYSVHDGNSTIGRYPDGASEVYVMNVPTIAKANLLTSYMVEESQQEIVSGVRPATMIASAGDFRIRYGSDMLFVKSEEPGMVTVDIYTPDGCRVDQIKSVVKGGTARVSVAHLPVGFYVARATDGQGNRVGCKFMK